MLLPRAALLDPAADEVDFARGERSAGGGHVAGFVAEGDAAENLVAGSGAGGEVEAELRHAGGLGGAVAGVAAVGKDGANVAIELDGLSRERGRADEERDEQPSQHLWNGIYHCGGCGGRACRGQANFSEAELTMESCGENASIWRLVARRKQQFRRSAMFTWLTRYCRYRCSPPFALTNLSAFCVRPLAEPGSRLGLEMAFRTRLPNTHARGGLICFLFGSQFFCALRCSLLTRAARGSGFICKLVG